MKTLKITARMLLVSAFIFFSACNKDDDSSLTSDATESEFDSPQFQVTDLSELENPELATPSETSELAFESAEANEKEPPCMRKPERMKNDNEKKCDDRKGKPGKQSHKPPKKENPRGLPFILKQLNLTETQKTSVKGFVAQHCDCVSEHHRKVHEIHQEMMKRANARRDELIAAHKAGRITKEQLDQQLKELRGRVKAEMQNHEDKHKRMRIMRGCREELNIKIESVLDANQLTKWNRWKAAHK